MAVTADKRGHDRYPRNRLEEWVRNHGHADRRPVVVGERASAARRCSSELGTRSFSCRCASSSRYFDGNTASGRAQAAAGYREVGRYRADRYVDGRWIDEVMTEMLREDWLKGNSV